MIKTENTGQIVIVKSSGLINRAHIQMSEIYNHDTEIILIDIIQGYHYRGKNYD